MLEFTLPYPPTINTYWRAVKTKYGIRFYISKKGKEFRKESFYFLPKLSNPKNNYLHLDLEIYPPDNRVRDIDNVLKPTLDCLMSANLIEDDYLIASLSVNKNQKEKPGYIACKLKDIEKKST